MAVALGFGLGSCFESIPGLGGGGGAIPFDFNNPKYGMGFDANAYTGQFPGANQAAANNNQDARWFRQQITANLPTTTINADDSVNIINFTGIRRSDRGLWSGLDVFNRVLQSNDLTITHHVVVAAGSGYTSGETLTCTGGGGGTGTYQLGTSTIAGLAYGIGASTTNICVRNGTGTFNGNLVGGTSGVSKAISSAVLVWQRSNITPTRDQTGPDGSANSATRITATANNGTISQVIPTLSSAARKGYVHAKRITGSGTLEMSIDNGANWLTISTTGNWKRFITAAITATDYTVIFRVGTSGDEFAISYVDVNSGTQESAPKVTTFAQRHHTRDRYSTSTTADGSATNPSSGLSEYIRGSNKWGLYVEFASREDPNFYIMSTIIHATNVSGTDYLNFSTDGGVNNVRDTGYVKSTLYNMENVNKVFAYVNGTEGVICVNGQTPIHVPTGFGIYNSGFGHNDVMTNGGGGTVDADGLIPEMRWFDFAAMQFPSDGQLQTVTT